MDGVVRACVLGGNVPGRSLEADVFHQLTELRTNAVLAIVCLLLWWTMGPTAPLRDVRLQGKEQPKLCGVGTISSAADSEFGDNSSGGLSPETPAHARQPGTPMSSTTEKRTLAHIEEAKRRVGAGEPLTLQLLIEIPRLRAVFAKHLEREYCAELITFYDVSSEQAIARYSRCFGCSEDTRRQWIVDNFVSENAPLQINISAKAREAAVSSISADTEAWSAQPFHLARGEVFDLMLEFSWPRFCRTQAFERAQALVASLSTESLLQRTESGSPHGQSPKKSPRGRRAGLVVPASPATALSTRGQSSQQSTTPAGDTVVALP